MTQPPSLVWGQRVQTTAATIVIPLDSNTQQDQAMFESDGNGVTTPTPYSQVQSNLCITRNDPCVPAAAAFIGSTLGPGTGTDGVIVTPPPTPLDYWVYDPGSDTCGLNPAIVPGTPTYPTQALCNEANGVGTGAGAYWAFDIATQSCLVNIPIVGGTPTYPSLAACQAANP